jgi:hypothetical protein
MDPCYCSIYSKLGSYEEYDRTLLNLKRVSPARNSIETPIARTKDDDQGPKPWSSTFGRHLSFPQETFELALPSKGKATDPTDSQETFRAADYF